jgi:uncharacterized membrane protein
VNKSRLECISDGVIAVIITIMVFELKAPHGTGVAELMPLVPTFLSYVLSFFFLCLYWNQHHHLLHAATQINGSVMWANLHLLFWLSLIPFATSYMDQNSFSGTPVALYGSIMFMAGVSYYILQRALIAANAQDSLLVKVVGHKDIRAFISPILWFLGVLIANFMTWIAIAIYVFIALMWVIPDRRIENAMAKS